MPKKTNKPKFFAPRKLESSDEIVKPFESTDDRIFMEDLVMEELIDDSSPEEIITPKEVSIPDDKELSHIGKNVFVYIGSMIKININGVLFTQGCPTYVPMKMIEQVKASADFALYKPGMGIVNSHGIETIGVTMPLVLENFILACTALMRLKEAFPVCNIKAVCNPDYVKYLPPGIKNVAYRQGRDNFYREYDLSDAKMTQYWLTPYNESIIQKHLIYMQAIGLYNKQYDSELKPYIHRKKRTGSKTVFIHDEGAFFTECKDIIRSKKVTWIHYNDVESSTLDECECLVSLVDHPFVMLSSYLSIPTFAMITKSIFKRQTQLKTLGAQVYSAPDKPDYPKAIATIREFITKNGISRKAL